MRGARLVVVSVVSVACAAASMPVNAQISAAQATSIELWFDAKASLGAFRGVTKTGRGEFSAAPSLAEVRGFVEAPSASLATGNGMRDGDMRKTLEVDKFPTIRFDLDSVAVFEQHGDSTRIELVGRMQIHGVSRALRIPAHLRQNGSTYRVTGSCELFLPNYGVTKLRRMLGMLSMNETIRIGLDVTFSPNTTPRDGAEDSTP